MKAAWRSGPRQAPLSAVIRVAEDLVPPAIDTKTRFVVFGFDEEQRDERAGGRHRTQLTEEYGLQVYPIGSTWGRRNAAFLWRTLPNTLCRTGGSARMPLATPPLDRIAR